MNIRRSPLAAFLFVPVVAFAQTGAAKPGPGLPPPGLNDPGVKPAAASSSARPLATKLPAMTGNAATPAGNPADDVRVRQDGDDTVQEYRRNGQLYMMVVTRKGGLPQTYMVDPQGRVVDDHGKKPDSPAMYKLMEWGKSKPAEASSSGN